MNSRNFVLTVLTAIVVAGLVAPAVAVAGNNIVVTLRGEGALMVEADNPPIAAPALCYETGLYNTKTDRLIGTGIDCLENADFVSNSPAVTLDRTTFFYFRHGTMAANGVTTVSPIFEGSPGPPSATHIVGDITGPGGDNILTEHGTGRYRNKTGRVRLSGAVDMSSAFGVIGFNCIFVIDLD